MPKVTAFVTRESKSSGGHELLVFRHPDAGIQFPAGSVEPGEEFSLAALREVTEETGLVDLHLTAHLGTVVTELTDVKALGAAATLRAGPSQQTQRLATIPRGWWCHVQSEQNGYTEIRYEELNRNVEPQTVIVRFTGWLETELLTDRMERGFFHIQSTGSSPDRWTHWAEDRFEFDCYWLPLDPKPEIHSPQQEWIDSYYEALLNSLRATGT